MRSSNMLFECMIEKHFIIIFIPGSQNSVYNHHVGLLNTYEPCLCSSILNGTFFLVLFAFVHILSHARTSCHVHFPSYVSVCIQYYLSCLHSIFLVHASLSYTRISFIHWITGRQAKRLRLILFIYQSEPPVEAEGFFCIYPLVGWTNWRAWQPAHKSNKILATQSIYKLWTWQTCQQEGRKYARMVIFIILLISIGD